jgi:MFS transporter, NNP family, nitrate/nitrite transporter
VGPVSVWIRQTRACRCVPGAAIRRKTADVWEDDEDDMDIQKATRIRLFNFTAPEMRAFHLTWAAFFLCFFGWFGIAPLMAVVREELSLTKTQIGNTIIASVAITIVARLVIGALLDRFGPRRVYTCLLAVGSLPVMGIGLSSSYETFLLFRLAIGAIGASFVVTQYHTSLMFAPNCVGTANATSAGWGNLGGGVTQMVMPLVMGAFVALGFGTAASWRLAMVVPGAALLVVAVLYYRLTQDTIDGDFDVLRREGRLPRAGSTLAGFAEAARDPRVWALFVIYGACFGVELTINNIAALYFVDTFSLDLKTAGILAGLFGLMNLFARTLGGVFGDRAGIRWGLRGRVGFLGAVLLLEGVALVVFSQMTALAVAVVALIVFSLFVQMSEGATYSIVPFISKKALGSVAGIVGAGGNLGAVAAGFLFRSEGLTTQTALFYLGLAVVASSSLVFAVRFSREHEVAAREELETRLRAVAEPMAAE